METRRRLQPVDSEDNGEDVDRRCSLRKKKRVRYDSKEASDVEDGDSEPSDDEQSDVSTSSSVKDRFPGTLRVTCGNKKGILDVEKLKTVKECIECEGDWFSPSAFEQLGGKGSSKKWKSTILYNNKPLQIWLDQQHLTTPRFKVRPSEASGSSDHKECHPKGSVIQSATEHDHRNEVGHDQQQPAGTEEEREEGTSEINTPFESNVLQKKAKVVIERLPGHIQNHLHLQSNGVALQENVTGGCIKPKVKDVQNRKEKQHTENASSASEKPSEDENNETEMSSTQDSESDHCEFKFVTVHAPTHQLSSPEDVLPDVHGLDATQQQQMEKCSQADGPGSIITEPAPMLSTSIKLETMDLEQLKREKLKMQLKVLKLQEEYYILQLKKLKQ